jgi:hypothetical protein
MCDDYLTDGECCACWSSWFLSIICAAGLCVVTAFVTRCSLIDYPLTDVSPVSVKQIEEVRRAEASQTITGRIGEISIESETLEDGTIQENTVIEFTDGREKRFVGVPTMAINELSVYTITFDGNNKIVSAEKEKR